MAGIPQIVWLLLAATWLITPWILIARINKILVHQRWIYEALRRMVTAQEEGKKEQIEGSN